MDPTILAGLLLIAAMILTAAEIFLPTFGILGLAGFASFAAYIYVTYVNGFASAVDIILIVSGLILILIELGVAGFGLPGISGSILLFLGLVGSSEDPKTGMVTVISGLIIAGGLGFLLVHFGYSSKILKKSILHVEQTKEAGYVAGAKLEKYLGQEGLANTMLRPSGIGDFSGDRVDVSSRGQYIKKGSKIKAIKIENGRLIVKEI